MLYLQIVLKVILFLDFDSHFFISVGDMIFQFHKLKLWFKYFYIYMYLWWDWLPDSEKVTLVNPTLFIFRSTYKY